MNRFVDWLKYDDGRHGRRYMIILRAVLMAALPVFCCIVYCASQNKTIGEVYLPASQWNDELFYYKQVEGIVNDGFPQGYLGYNESHSAVLSFAAWSPMLVFPWVIWGILFGWGFLSPVICNIFLMAAAMFLFMILAKPDWKKTGILALLFCLFTPFVRYMLSGMPEIICISLLIIFYGMAYFYLEEEKNSRRILLFVLSGLLTLMRPYLLLFMLLPAYFSVRKYRGKGVLLSGIWIAGAVGLYGLISHFLIADYISPIINFSWVEAFVESGIGYGVRNIVFRLYYQGNELRKYIIEGFHSGLPTGAFFDGTVVVLLVLMLQFVTDIRKRYREHRKKQLVLGGHLIVSIAGMFFAQLLMYDNLFDGCKHFLTFTAVGIFVVAMMETRAYKKAVLIGAAFAYLYMYRAVVPYDAQFSFLYRAEYPYDYQVPFKTREAEEMQRTWREVFDKEIVLNRENVPNYENVMIWTVNDLKDGEEIYTKWQVLYALPEGMGISGCTRDYVKDHLKNLHSRYIMTLAGGDVDRMCGEEGYAEIARDGDIVIYSRRDGE